MKFKILGSGASAGVPQLGCSCKVCLSNEPKNQRFRSSALIQSDLGKNVLIDIGPDFRRQALNNQITKVDALYITHVHSDHIDGLNELRPLSFIHDEPVELYIREKDLNVLKKRFDYIFDPDPKYPGAPPAKFNVNIIEAYQSIEIFDVPITPFTLEHGNTTVAGVLCKNLAYAPDCCGFPEQTKELLNNIETLILDAIWPERIIKHHFNVEQAIAAATEINAKKTFLTHLSHFVDYKSISSNLPEGFSLCFDGLGFEI